MDRDQVFVLLDRAHAEFELAGRQPLLPGVDLADFLPALAVRAVEDQAKDVQSEFQRDLRELIAAVHAIAHGADEDVVSVEFDFIADWKLAAQVDLVEHGAAVDRDIAEDEAAAGARPNADRLGNARGVAKLDQRQPERPEHLSVGVSPPHHEPRVVQRVLAIAGKEQVGAHEREVAGGANVVLAGRFLRWFRLSPERSRRERACSSSGKAWLLGDRQFAA